MSLETEEKKSNWFSPRMYLERRRPELFSDSVETAEPILTTAQLDYHLQTLTKRKEETCFELFCRRIVQKSLCPNLLPQTGPTGGGDSKVDAETYPVADQIAALWYVGEARASKERWAFAFSAKEIWSTKATSDIKKIVETDRNYKVIYFVTSQFVPDKKRAAFEDKLRKEHKIDIRVLDRTFLLKTVEEQNLWDIACQTLNIGTAAVKKKPGPLDVEREQDLERLENELADMSKPKSLQYVEDCLETALLARGLSKPRVEIDGRFDRAERECESYGNSLQRFRILYQRAWTANFWYEDYKELDRVYEQAEPLVISTEPIWILDKLISLCQIGFTWALADSDAARIKTWSERLIRLQKSLETRLSKPDRTTAMLWTRTQLLFLDHLLARDSSAQSELFRGLKNILDKAKHHPDYPMEPMFQIIQMVGEHVSNKNKEYVQLFDKVLEIQDKREGEAKRGQSRLARGFQLLHADTHYGAIDYLAKAQSLLAKEEHHAAFVMAVVGTGLAYSDAGLHWASRANLVVAAEKTLFRYLKFGEVPSYGAIAFIQELIWAELRLGRVVCALNWIELLQVVASARELTNGQVNDHRLTDALLAILILKTPFADLISLKRMPAVLSELGLEGSRAAILFCLGHENASREALGLKDGDINNYITKNLWQQPARHDLPKSANWYVELPAKMHAQLLGCTIELIAADQNSLVLGETILGYVEAFLSTALTLDNCMAMRPSLLIQVENDSKTDGLSLSVEEDDCGETSIHVRFNHEGLAKIAEDAKLPEFLYKVLSQVMIELELHISPESLEKLFSEHEAPARATWSGYSISSLGHLLGSEPKYLLKDWLGERECESFDVIRSIQWAPELIETDSTIQKPGKSQPKVTSDMTGDEDIESLRHQDFKVQSPINMRLWARAGWCAVGFVTSLQDLSAIDLQLGFTNEDDGKKIFRGWRKKVGAEDLDDWLKVSIITGIDRMSPLSYRVVISSNEESLNWSDKGRMLVANQVCDMHPVQPGNLQRFLQSYEQAGWYRFMPAKYQTRPLYTSNEKPIANDDLAIKKCHLHVVPAWEIGPDHTLFTAISTISDPLIPRDVSSKSAPITEAIRVYNRFKRG